MYPLLTQAQVISQDPATGGLNIVLPSGQMCAYPVRFGYYGPADGMRVNHPALPGRGTWGLVAFPGGDNRAGVWLNSFYSQFIDARTSNTDAFMEYNSHFSGFYETLSKIGQRVQRYPDGTTIIIGADTTPPPVHRHVVNPVQRQVLQEFTDAERVPSPPSPFNVLLTHASGTSAQIAPDGTVTVNSGAGQTIFQMTPEGIINITAGTQINIGGIVETLFRLMDERMIAIYNNHTHGGVQAGGDVTGVPGVPLTIGAETTTITFAG